MQHNAIAARAWSRDLDAPRTTSTLEAVTLFSVLGLVASAAVLLTSSSQTVAAVTPALMM